ncbi:YheC/YheD family protein [Lysinibacillus sp. Bpr_S20]|uniref:YheC/YheD family protein n=1 Tax=Lysinibacillus sp. Bpr_S20 TaxID=2933964 RepID=UPI002012296F|nr:YheC/YheD family protein [Lysinibacillus sp. Bpr_S20]MCL1699939.1 YheC/YheD family protein [Lysinibacillus sp. Bpr_S20]
MSKIQNQISLVTETMVESIDYMKAALKNNNIDGFLPVFISIVEGLQALDPYIKQQNDEELISLYKETELQVIQCADLVQAADFQNILATVQFSLEPSLRKLHESFKVTDEKNDKQIIIGMHYGPENPIFAYTIDRIRAELEEAERQNCKMYFFASKDVDIEKEVIHARFSLESEETETISIPDVIYNIFPKIDWNQDSVEKWLRTKAPFTTFPLEDKVMLPRKLLRASNLGHLLIPFIAVTDLEKVFDFLKIHKKGVFKRAAAARGENIFLVEQKSNDRFVVEVNKKPILMNHEGFSNWVSKYLIPDYYILQEYREFRTRSGNPFDFRAHMQKNGEGKWELTRLYPRIGSRKGILSNISRGGHSQELHEFLFSEFNKKDAEYYSQSLHDLSFEIANAIDRIYSYSINEMGIDLAIDKEGHIYMHEANPVPQSKYHEKERAVNMIAYAKYLAKQRLFLTNDVQKEPAFKDQFFYKNHPEIEVIDLDKSKVTIGFLYEKHFTGEKYLEACALMAHHANVNFYAFRIQDIDYENKVIKGRFLEDFAWKEKIVRYPDVILDRLRMKNNPTYQLAYEEFANIPFSHTLDMNNLNKVTINNRLAAIDSVKHYVIPHIENLNEDSLYNFIEEYNTIILKPIHGSFAVGIIKLSKVGNRYIWTEDETIEYSWTQIKRICNDRDIYKNYLVQKFIESKSLDDKPIDFRIHMIKDPTDSSKWCIAREYVRVSDGGFKINTQTFNEGRAFSGTMTYINRYVTQNFPNNYKDIIDKVWNAAYEIADAFNQLHDGQVNEQALDLALTLEGDIYIIEINANRPGVFGYEYDIARHMIPFVKTLAKVGGTE